MKKLFENFIIYIYLLCVCRVFMYHSMHVEVGTTLVSWFALSAMWLPGIELRL